MNSIKRFAFLALLTLPALANGTPHDDAANHGYRKIGVRSAEYISFSVPYEMLGDSSGSSTMATAELKSGGCITVQAIRDNVSELVLQVSFPESLDNNIAMKIFFGERNDRSHALCFELSYKEPGKPPVRLNSGTVPTAPWNIPSGFIAKSVGFNVYPDGPTYQYKRVAPGIWNYHIEKCIDGRSCCFSCPCSRCIHED